MPVHGHAPLPLPVVKEALPWIFGFWLLVIVALNVWYFSRMAARSRAGDPMFSVAPAPTGNPTVGPDAASHKVGAWINGYSATAPDFELRFDDQALELLGGLSGSIKVARDEVIAVEPVKGLAATGFQLQTATGRLDRVVVYTWGSAALDGLSACGWPVLHQRPRRVLRQMWRM